MKALIVVLVLCACSSHGTGTGGGQVGSGTAAPPPVSAAKTCDDVKPRVEQMYRSEAQSREPKRVDEYVADNTHMVMTDCAKDPAKAVPCLAKAGSIAELEKQCVVPLDDEGTEASR